MSNANNQNNPNIDQSYFIQLETLLNNNTDWENNPIEATRGSIKQMLSIIKTQQLHIHQLERSKATKSELSSSLNIKANIADMMRTFSDITTNMESRPTMEDIQLLLDEKISKDEIMRLLSSKTTLDEVKVLLSRERVKLDVQSSFDDLRKNFITKREFSEIIETKADKDKVIYELNNKADKGDIESILKNTVDINDYQNMENILNEEIEKINMNNNIANSNEDEIKAIAKKIKDIDQDIDRLIENIRKEFQNVNNAMNNISLTKADKEEIEKINKKSILDRNKIYDDIINKVKNNIYENGIKVKEEIIILINNLDQRIKNECFLYEKNTSDQIDKINNDIYNKHNIVNKEISKIKSELNTNKDDIIELNNKLNALSSHITERDALINPTTLKQQYVNTSELDNLYQLLQKSINDKFEEVKLYTQDYIKNFDNDIQELLDKKANFSEMAKILSTKVDLNSLQSVLDFKVSRKEFDYIKLSLEKINKDYVNKADYSKFETYVKGTSTALEEIQKDLMMKANIKEMMSFFKSKADIDEVNKALTLIHDELDTKSNILEFNQGMDNQNAINEVLYRENCKGKWLWNSGEVKNGYAVPWEVQSINTSPENFIWEKDKTSVMVMEKGIYILSIAFFVKDKPTVQILVNGECVLSVVNANAFAVRREEFGNIGSGNEGDNDKESVTGMTMSDFLLLREKSRVAISYSGSDNVKGFMSLQKL